MSFYKVKLPPSADGAMLDDLEGHWYIRHPAGYYLCKRNGMYHWGYDDKLQLHFFHEALWFFVHHVRLDLEATISWEPPTDHKPLTWWQRVWAAVMRALLGRLGRGAP